MPFLPVMKAHEPFILKTHSWRPTLQKEIQDNWKCHPNSIRHKNEGFGFGPNGYSPSMSDAPSTIFMEGCLNR